jgi:hypothetical protein
VRRKVSTEKHGINACLIVDLVESTKDTKTWPLQVPIASVCFPGVEGRRNEKNEKERWERGRRGRRRGGAGEG